MQVRANSGFTCEHVHCEAVSLCNNPVVLFRSSILEKRTVQDVFQVMTEFINKVIKNERY